jgi:hypothetical protein
MTVRDIPTTPVYAALNISCRPLGLYNGVHPNEHRKTASQLRDAQATVTVPYMWRICYDQPH